jgi:hypothetical protein
MGELERDTPTSRHIRPELLLGVGMVFPERSQVLRAYYQDIDDRRRRRAGEFEDELLDAAHCSPEEIIKRILTDERAEELFERAVHQALLAADEHKRRALARAVASGLLASDDAVTDEAHFLIRAITALEPSHIRLLLALERPNESQPHQQVNPMAYTAPQLEDQTGMELVELLLTRLAAEGLASDWSDTSLTITGEGVVCWAITEFGRRVLELLRNDPHAAASSPQTGTSPT